MQAILRKEVAMVISPLCLMLVALNLRVSIIFLLFGPKRHLYLICFVFLMKVSGEFVHMSFNTLCVHVHVKKTIFKRTSTCCNSLPSQMGFKCNTVKPRDYEPGF